MEVEENGREVCSTTGSSCFRGTRGLSSMPRERLHALFPGSPNWSVRASSPMEAASPMV